MRFDQLEKSQLSLSQNLVKHKGKHPKILVYEKSSI
jgi:hypothetical protein